MGWYGMDTGWIWDGRDGLNFFKKLFWDGFGTVLGRLKKKLQ